MARTLVHDSLEMAKIAPPTIHVVAGPNGAGKTTFARSFLPEYGCRRFLNADLIAAGLSPLSPATGAIRAARILLEEWEVLTKSKQTFGFETTMSGRVYASRLRQAQEAGYQVNIYYIWIPTVTVVLRRIRQRVAKGGHDVPSKDVKRRFRPSLENFFALYLPIADEALLFDGSARPPKLVAEIRKEEQMINEWKTYEKIKQAIQSR
ncbi:MAG: AAA family ATPase [Pseudomonadota bacterium]